MPSNGLSLSRRVDNRPFAEPGMATTRPEQSDEHHHQERRASLSQHDLWLAEKCRRCGRQHRGLMAGGGLDWPASEPLGRHERGYQRTEDDLEEQKRGPARVHRRTRRSHSEFRCDPQRNHYARADCASPISDTAESPNSINDFGVQGARSAYCLRKEPPVAVVGTST